MINYALIRSKRRTIAIFVKDSAVVVKAPLKTDMQKIEAFVYKNENWISKKLNQNSQKNRIFQDVLNYEKFLFCGKSFLPKFQPVKHGFFQEDFLILPQKWLEIRRQSEKKFLKKIEAFYKIEAEKFLSKRLLEISSLINLPFHSFKIGNAKTKWGTCDGLNNICLNWRLSLLPQELSDYVMIHELCHTYYHNHSSSFWLFVNKFDVTYKIHKKNLKAFSVIIQKLFRYDDEKI